MQRPLAAYHLRRRAGNRVWFRRQSVGSKAADLEVPPAGRAESQSDGISPSHRRAASMAARALFKARLALSRPALQPPRRATC